MLKRPVCRGPALTTTQLRVADIISDRELSANDHSDPLSGIELSSDVAPSSHAPYAINGVRSLSSIRDACIMGPILSAA